MRIQAQITLEIPEMSQKEAWGFCEEGIQEELLVYYQTWEKKFEGWETKLKGEEGGFSREELQGVKEWIQRLEDSWLQVKILEPCARGTIESGYELGFRHGYEYKYWEINKEV